MNEACDRQLNRYTSHCHIIMADNTTTQTNNPYDLTTELELTNLITTTQPHDPHVLKIEAELAETDNAFTILIPIPLGWETEYDIYNFLLTRNSVRLVILHHIYHIQECIPETVFIFHATFPTSIAFGMNTTDKYFCRRLRELLYSHPLHVNKTTTHV